MGKKIFYTASVFKFTLIKIKFCASVTVPPVKCSALHVSGGHYIGHSDLEGGHPSLGAQSWLWVWPLRRWKGQHRTQESWDRKTGSQQGLGLSKAGPGGHLWYNFRRTSEAFLPPSLEFHNPIITTLPSTSHVLGTVLQAMRVLNLLNAHKNSRYH